MNTSIDFIWTVFRDNREHARAVDHKQCQQIVRHAQRLYPNSRFRAVYTGKNLGIRRSEEFCG